MKNRRDINIQTALERRIYACYSLKTIPVRHNIFECLAAISDSNHIFDPHFSILLYYALPRFFVVP